MTLVGTFGIGLCLRRADAADQGDRPNRGEPAAVRLLVLCANFFPFAALPPFLLKISRLIPLAYAVDAFRSTLMGFPPGFPELAPIKLENRDCHPVWAADALPWIQALPTCRRSRPARGEPVGILRLGAGGAEFERDENQIGLIYQILIKL